jgi:hypothetical protein
MSTLIKTKSNAKSRFVVRENVHMVTVHLQRHACVKYQSMQFDHLATTEQSTPI